MGVRRWLTILAPVAIIAVIETLSDSALDDLLPFPRDTLLVVGVVAVMAIVAGRAAWRSIDHLTETLERRNRELEARTATTRALHQVAIAIAGLADLDAILRVIVDSARELLGGDIAVVARTRPDGSLHAAASSGRPELLLPDPSATDDVRAFIAPTALAAELEAPLRRGDQTVGALAVGFQRARSFGVDDIETLATLANQASIAIENARLQERLREVAVRGERERIARELHDGLAQVLSYVNTKSQAVEGLLDAGRTSDARSHLVELATAARSVYVDVREAILGLSTPVLEAGGLAATIERYAERFADASKLAVRVAATPAAAAVDLPPTIEAQAFRIVQEALTNVRKHAAANRVEISIDVCDDALCVEVRDDGRGLLAAKVAPEAWPRYGVTSMRERAATIGGVLDVDEAQGGGTRVSLVVPLARQATPAGTGD